MKVKLSKTERDYLASKEDTSVFIDRFALGDEISELSVLDMPEDDATDLRELCGQWLQREGFDSNYDLTSAGKICQSLIDKLFVP